MPEPIASSPSSPPWTATAERELDLAPQQQAGPTAREQAARYTQSTLQGGTTGMFTSGVQHLLGELAAGSTGVAAGLAWALSGPGATLVSLLEGYSTEMQQADAMNEAYRRDALRLAVTWLAADVLPRDYVANQEELLRHAGGSPGIGGGPANRLVTRLATEGQFSRAKEQAAHQAQLGRTMATAPPISSPAELQQRLASDVRFAALYHHPDNVAFRLGVDSVVWQATHPSGSPVSPTAVGEAR